MVSRVMEARGVNAPACRVGSGRVGSGILLW